MKRQFNKEKHEEFVKKAVIQRRYKHLGTSMIIPINHHQHKILATALYNKDKDSHTLTLSIAKETGDMPIWHQFEDSLEIHSKRDCVRQAVLAKVVELESAGEFDIHIQGVDTVYKLLENTGDYLCGKASLEEVLK